MGAVQELRRFVAQTFYPPPELTDEASLVASGTIDRTGVFSLQAFVERRFRVLVPERAIVEGGVDTIAAVAAYVDCELERRRAPRRSTRSRRVSETPTQSHVAPS